MNRDDLFNALLPHALFLSCAGPCSLASGSLRHTMQRMENDDWNSSSDDDSDDSSSGGSLGDSSQRFQDILSRVCGPAVPPSSQRQWDYSTRSPCSAEALGNLRTKVLDHNKFQLVYNPTDALLLEKAKAEVKQSLSKARIKLYGYDDGQTLEAGACFAATLPSN